VVDLEMLGAVGDGPDEDHELAAGEQTAEQGGQEGVVQLLVAQEGLHEFGFRLALGLELLNAVLVKKHVQGGACDSASALGCDLEAALDDA